MQEGRERKNSMYDINPTAWTAWNEHPDCVGVPQTAFPREHWGKQMEHLMVAGTLWNRMHVALKDQWAKLNSVNKLNLCPFSIYSILKCVVVTEWPDYSKSIYNVKFQVASCVIHTTIQKFESGKIFYVFGRITYSMLNKAKFFWLKKLSKT